MRRADLQPKSKPAPTLRWHRTGDGEYEAELNGVIVATASRRHSRSGDWGAWRYRLYGVLRGPGVRGASYADTLKEAREIVARRLAAVEAQKASK